MPLYRFADKIILFIHIPKTGGTSCEHALRDAGGKQALFGTRFKPFARCNPQHMHAAALRELVRPGFYDYAFTLVRHPLDRIVSEYKMQATKNPNLPSFQSWLIDVFARYEKEPCMLDNHIRPQSDFIVPGCEVFRFEDGLKAPINAALEAAGCPPVESPPHEKRPGAIQVSPSHAAIAMVEDFYRADFERFGYSPFSSASTLAANS